MMRQKNLWNAWAYVALAAMSTLLLAGCGSSSSTTATPIEPTVNVTDTAGAVVAGAVVYAIPAADVAELAAMPITRGNAASTEGQGNYGVAAKQVDEPLEDLVNNNFTPTSGGVANYVTVTTDATGSAVLTGLPVGATDMFFIYVAPAVADTAHLPGGSMSRNAVSGASLDNTITAVELSTNPSAAATYIGSSECLGCHASKDLVKQTAHKHGIMNIGSPSGLQDLTQFDANDGIYNYMAGVDKFTTGDVTSGGTTVWFYNFDGTRGFDKYQAVMTDPRIAAPSTVVYASVRMYQDSTSNKYMMQITNILDPTDPNSPLNVEAVMTYGGGVYKQRYLTKSASGASLHMLPLQYQASGADASTDRTRQQYRDYHMDRWYDQTNSLLITEPAASKSFDINCASCHFNGYQVSQNAGGEFTATAVADINGTMNPVDGNAKQEMNVGCETCHGPGSEHKAAGGLGVAIVNPNDLSVSRVTMLCGRCHSRPQGNSSFAGVNTDQPTNIFDEMLHPGASRAEYLADYTNRDDAKDSSMWADGLHSKSHHQQYTDFIQTPKYRNGSALKTCVDCHEIHAPGTDRHQLSGTSDNTMCASCHSTQGADIVAHMTAKTGANMNALGGTTLCIDCHFAKNAKSGAGDPTGEVGASATYRHNDISSHLLTVATKADAVAQQMPVPYTNSCGICHSLSSPL